jgi:hypothetical protein
MLRHPLKENLPLKETEPTFMVNTHPYNRHPSRMRKGDNSV